MCAWHRQAYPDQTAGCVAQSAVVQAIYDFPGMDTRARTVIASPDGGECLASLQATYAALSANRTDAQFATLLQRFNASNLATTPLGKLDFAFSTADAALMLVQYGQKAALCEHMLKLGPGASDNERISQFLSLIKTHYGGGFMGACAHNSQCLRVNAGKVDNNLSWWWQTCSQLGYLQRSPEWDENAWGSEPFDAPLRSKNITFPALVGQCDYLFGKGTGAAGATANRAFNGRFGGSRPRSRSPPNLNPSPSHTIGPILKPETSRPPPLAAQS